MSGDPGDKRSSLELSHLVGSGLTRFDMDTARRLVGWCVTHLCVADESEVRFLVCGEVGYIQSGGAWIGFL